MPGYFGQIVTRKLIVEADGGSRGNPGSAGSGAVVIDYETGNVLFEVVRYIGVATNNVAEYVALIAGLEQAFEHDPDAEVLVRMDSKLVIEQMAGRWKIKHPDMQQLAIRVQALVRGKVVSWQWIPREQNSLADALANQAMDQEGDSILQKLSLDFADQSEIHEDVPFAAAVEFNSLLPSSVRAPKVASEPATTIILVRHGRTALTESKRMSGRGAENPPLSSAGEQDATAVAVALEHLGTSGPWAFLAKPNAVVTSPVARADQTAKIIANRLGVPKFTNDDLSEISFGTWDGLTPEEAAAKDPALWDAWRGSWTTSPPMGEALQDFDLRIQRAFDAILSEHSGKVVVVVAHVMPIRGFLRTALEAGDSAYWRPQIAPCSISIIRCWGRLAAEVLTVNSTSHL